MPNPSAQVFKPVLIPETTSLPHHPPPRQDLALTDRLSGERLDLILDSVPADFLTPQELDLLAFVLVQRQDALAFTDAERGTFSREFYPDYEIPVIEHVPWAREPIRFPKALEPQVRALLDEQQKAGKYEYSSASYRSRVFPVMKKSNKLRLVHDLQDLNQYVVRDSALPPRPDDFAESFVGHAIYGVADLYSGFDACTLAEVSRDLTTFHSLNGPQRLTVLPQGCTNSVPEFQRRSLHAIQPEVPNHADVFIDDVGIKGPGSTYNNAPLADNPNIRRFVYEYATILDRVFLRFQTAGVTASGSKLVLATPKVQIVGSVVSIDGWHLSHGIVSKVLNWPTPKDVSDVRGFLGVAGVGRRWIKDFSLIAKPLTALCRKSDDAFCFTGEAQHAMDALKRLVTESPVLKKLDYGAASLIRPPPRTSDHGLVVVAVDSSIHGSGWVLYQIEEIERHPVLFGSCTFNQAESRYSQPKIELYGVFRAIKELRHRVWGVHFSLEVDAKFLQQMIKEPDLPNAPMTRWVSYIQLFDFNLLHVPATKGVAQDALSRRGRAPEDSDNDDAEEFLDKYFGMLGERNDTLSPYPHDCLILNFHDDAMTRKGILGIDSGWGCDTVTELSTLGGSLETRMRTLMDRQFQRAATSESFWNANIYRGDPVWLHHLQRRNLARRNAAGLWEVDEQWPMFPSLLAMEDDVSYIGGEFMTRKVAKADVFQIDLGDGLRDVPVVLYAPAWSGGHFPKPTDRAKLQTRRIGWATTVHTGRPEFYETLDRVSLYPGDTFAYERTDHRWELGEVAVGSPADVPCVGHQHGTKERDGEAWWKEVEEYLRDGKRPERFTNDVRGLRAFEKAMGSYAWKDQRLWRVSPNSLPRLVITDLTRRRQLIDLCHRFCGHRGRTTDYTTLRERYYWPNMFDDIAWFVRSCNVCQFRARSRPVELLSITLSPAVRRRVVVDTVYMPDGVGGMKFLLHTSDATSKWPEGRAARKNDSKTWTRFILEDIIARLGCVPVIICDGGSEFKGAARELLEKYNIAVIMSSPYHPQGNGIAERDGQTLFNALMKMCGAETRLWPRYLPAALLAVRVTTSRATGFSPYFLTYGQDCLFPFEMADRTWQTIDWNEATTTEDLLACRAKQLTRLPEFVGQACRNLEAQRQRAIDDYHRRNEHRMRGELEPGTWVLVHETWLDNQHGNKGALRWAGPYVVHQRHASGSYTLRELDGTVLKQKVAGNRIKLFYFRDDNQTMALQAAPEYVLPPPPPPASSTHHDHPNLRLDEWPRAIFNGTQVSALTYERDLQVYNRRGPGTIFVQDNSLEGKDLYRGQLYNTNIRELLEAQKSSMPWY